MGPLAWKSQRKRNESRKAARSVMCVSHNQEYIKAVVNNERHGAEVQGEKKIKNKKKIKKNPEAV